MDWIQTLIIVLTILGSVGWIFTKLDTDIKSVNDDIKQAHRRMDQLFSTICNIQSEIKDIYKSWPK